MQLFPRLTTAFLLLTTSIVARGADHPGNIFLHGEDVRITVPSDWKSPTWAAFDIDNTQVAKGTATDHVMDLGELPIGYFQLRETGGVGKTYAGVMAKSRATENTPIALDTAMSWFYSDPKQIKDVCALCRLAGVKWIRERSSWPEIEPARGVWAPDGRYEQAMRIEHESGLKVLQVNHVSPPWANKDSKHFPEDLRDVYQFYRGLAERWKGLTDAIEPWNEPDIIEFGGHTGCEIASLQKAAYLGLKAGNPQLPVNEAVFATARPETLAEFGANEVYPYFDRYDLHHYTALTYYPLVYGRHRAVSGGRPMWTTEFNLTVNWADEKTKEPTDDDLHVQAYRVGKMFAEVLNQGAEKAFYFILGDYVERKLQYGLIHHDLTPRPAFVAFAAVGRLLNGAKPIGKVDLGNDNLMGYLFATIVDGAPHETLVAWSETKPTTVDIPGAQRTFDYLGRDLPPGTKMDLSRATLFALLPPGGSKGLKIIPAPANSPWLPGNPSPVVLQLLGETDFKQSAFRLNAARELKVVAYNFGATTIRGTLSGTFPTDFKGQITLEPGARHVQTINVNGPGNLTVHFDLTSGDRPIVAARLVNSPTTQTTK